MPIVYWHAIYCKKNMAGGGTDERDARKCEMCMNHRLDGMIDLAVRWIDTGAAQSVLQIAPRHQQARNIRLAGHSVQIKEGKSAFTGAALRCRVSPGLAPPGVREMLDTQASWDDRPGVQDVQPPGLGHARSGATRGKRWSIHELDEMMDVHNKGCGHPGRDDFGDGTEEGRHVEDQIFGRIEWSTPTENIQPPRLQQETATRSSG